MKSITDIRYVTGPINDESMQQFGDALNAGFEIMSMDLSWVDKMIHVEPNKSPEILPYQVPGIIAILVKFSDVDPSQVDINDLADKIVNGQ